MPHECTTCGHVFADGSKEMLSGCPDCGGNKFQFKPAAATEREETTRAGEREDATPATEREDATPATEREQPTSNTAGPDGTHGDRDETPSDAADPRRDLSKGSTEWPDHGHGSAADSEAVDSNPTASDSSAPESSPTDAVAGAGDSDPTADSVDAGATDAEGTGTGSGPTPDRSPEDPAQADARSDVVSPDEIPAATPEETEGTATPDAPGSPATHDDDRRADTADSATEPTPDDRPGLEGLREELNEQFESIRIVAPGEYELNLMELYDRTEYIISLQEDGRYIIEVPDTWDTTPDPDET